MNSQEACRILGIEPGASDEELTAAFRKKASKLHPDVNKSDTAERDFKQLNEAYQLLKKHGTQQEWVPGASRVHFDFDMSDMGGVHEYFRSVFFGGQPPRQQQVSHRQVKGFIQIDFAEAITGAEKPVSYERSISCPDCNGVGSRGQGGERKCGHCDGKGKRKYGVQDKELPCRNCKGTGRFQETIPCAKCVGTGKLRQIENVEIPIPAGVTPGASIKVPGAGDYLPRYKTYADAIFSVHVLADRELSRDGNDVVSTIDIDLVDALKGAQKKVRTVRGEKTLKIHKGARHKDTIRVNGFGVPPSGGHLFVLDVKYPQNRTRDYHWR
jgi:molecular chaperone DnaJ